MKAYLAAPFFSQNERYIYARVIDYLRNAEQLDLYVPMEHTVEDAWNLSNSAWGWEVFKEDVRALDEAKVVYVLNFGMYSDSGTAWEAGYAYAKGKRIVNILVNQKDNVYSLMMINSSTILVNVEFESMDESEVEQK
ncbi:MAG: nucleoside 2-deoxyribosyltransferase [Prevotella sp.]|nr:nucleoside 2-deoxyribosyltransferase [Prevotella sp.]